MKRLSLWGAIISLVLLVSCKKNTESVDVCIYGGTSAGVIAAYTASMEGKTVLLVEPGRHLGGMTSGGLGYTDIGNKFVVPVSAADPTEFERQNRADTLASCKQAVAHSIK